MSMLSARLRIKGVDVELSPQFSIDCNYYNQGCDGGYPFLVEKFVAESSVLQEHEYPYTGHTGKCRRKHGHTKKYKVSNYRFIGGAYGKSNEENIMEELMKNGPIVMNFEPSFDFMFYVGGVYHTTVPDWLVNGLARPEWVRVIRNVRKKLITLCCATVGERRKQERSTGCCRTAGGENGARTESFG